MAGRDEAVASNGLFVYFLQYCACVVGLHPWARRRLALGRSGSAGRRRWKEEGSGNLTCCPRFYACCTFAPPVGTIIRSNNNLIPSPESR
jgi:hypothetical protein